MTTLSTPASQVTVETIEASTCLALQLQDVQQEKLDVVQPSSTGHDSQLPMSQPAAVLDKVNGTHGYIKTRHAICIAR